MPPPAKPKPPAKRNLSPSANEGVTVKAGQCGYRDVRLATDYPSGGSPPAAAASGSDSSQALWTNYNRGQASAEWLTPTATRNDQWRDNNRQSDQSQSRASASRDRGWGSSWGSKWDQNDKNWPWDKMGPR
jgi:hypothetical protein